MRRAAAMTTAPQALKIAETAVALSCAKSTVYELINSGRLRYIRLTGGSIRVPQSAISEFLAGKTFAREVRASRKEA